MKRAISTELKSWSTANVHDVLLLRGARQVGKTYSIRELGKDFPHYLEVNFEEHADIHRFFAQSLTPDTLNEKLSAYFAVPIKAGKTLLFFDEIQACPNALRALRFYQEKMPALHVVAAGSLLEFALEEIPSFGVGRIASLHMYPMSFAEFLWALEESALHDMILRGDARHPVDDVFHHRLLDRFGTFQLLGGMPRVVRTYAEARDLRVCQILLDEMISNLQDDFAKYRKRAPVLKLQETFRSVAFQAGEKFTYSKITDVGAQQGYKDALELLHLAGLAHKIHHSSARGIPLGAQINPKRFKVIPFDGGIHQRLLGIDLAAQLVRDEVEMINKGSLAETTAGLELVKHESPRQRAQLFYWHREEKASNAEVDYVLQKNGNIIPIEVKAGTKGQMQSLHIFIRERGLSFGVRLSHENFGAYGPIRTVPIYAVERIGE